MVQKKIAQTLMHRHFATIRHAVFTKIVYAEINW